MIKLSTIYKLKDSKKYINDVIDSDWISFTGKYVSKCETFLQNKLNVKHVLLTNNGTSATHCIIKSIKIKNPNCNKIYVQNNCYIAVYNMILMEFKKEQITILPTDNETWNLDLNYLNRIEKNAALVIINNIGNILPVNIIKKKKPDIIIVEDNCEGFMGKNNNIYSGTESLSSAISFYPNKHITCAEGGAFITNDTFIYNKIKSFCRQGNTNKKFIHNITAFNYRLNNINAAILFSQLEKIDEIIEKKKDIYLHYLKLLKNNNNIRTQKIMSNTEHSYWLIGINFENISYSYDELHKIFQNNNIEIRPFFYDIRKHEHLKDIKILDDKYFDNNIILLPLHPLLKKKDVKTIIKIIKTI